MTWHDGAFIVCSLLLGWWGRDLVRLAPRKAPFCTWCGAVRVEGGGRCPECVKFTGDQAAPSGWPRDSN